VGHLLEIRLELQTISEEMRVVELDVDDVLDAVAELAARLGLGLVADSECCLRSEDCCGNQGGGRQRAGKRHLQQYNAFYKHWMDRLDAITRNGTDFRYAPGVQYSLQMDNVTNQLQAAASVMRDMVRPYAVKPHTERQADIRAATGYLHAAGTVLTNLPH
jgi:hypothetical protein